jgi:hypothetical protein
MGSRIIKEQKFLEFDTQSIQEHLVAEEITVGLE